MILSLSIRFIPQPNHDIATGWQFKQHLACLLIVSQRALAVHYNYRLEDVHI